MISNDEIVFEEIISDDELDIGKVWDSIHWGKRNIVKEKGQELVVPIDNVVNRKIAKEIAKQVNIKLGSDSNE